MGSFNVACGLSSVSIDERDEVVFVPIYPANAYYRKDMVHEIEPTSLVIHHDQYFVPFAFPIKGKYNDYGQVSEIEENENTKLLEEKYGLSVEMLLRVISCPRGKDISDSHGDMFEAYAVNQEGDFYNLSPETMLNLGFELTFSGDYCGHMVNSYVIEGHEYSVQLTLEDNKFEIYRLNSDCPDIPVYENRSSHAGVPELILEYERLTGWVLNVAKENQERVKFLRRSSGMFILRSVYDKVIEAQKGFWTGEYWFTTSQIERIYKEFVDAYAESYELKVKCDSMEKGQEGYDEVCRDMLYADMNIRRLEFPEYFKNWMHMEDLYGSLFSKGLCEDMIVDFYNLQRFMVGANKMWFPSYNGEQHGSVEHEKAMVEAINVAVEGRATKWDEY